MYTVQRSRTISEELEVKNLDGTSTILPVRLCVDEALASYNRLRRILGEAQEKLKNDPDNEQLQAYYGKAVTELFTIVFGQEGAARLLEIYENRPEEMLGDVAPFLVDVVQPQFELAMAERAKKYRRLTKNDSVRRVALFRRS